MARGRKPTPNAILKLRGSYEKARHGDRVELDASTPTCPTWLGTKAKAEWKRLTKALEKQGVISQVDRNVLAVHCQAVEDYVTARKTVEREGSVIVGGMGGLVENPMSKIMFKAWDRILKSAQELGFSPVSRCRVKASKPKEVDDLDAFIKRKKKA